MERGPFVLELFERLRRDEEWFGHGWEDTSLVRTRAMVPQESGLRHPSNRMPQRHAP